MRSYDATDRDPLAAWRSLVDLGGIVSVDGEVLTIHTGELSVHASDWRMASEELRPLPTDHKPMSDESRVRQRYVDLIVRLGARDAVRLRADVVRSLRQAPNRHGYLEVEAPMLQVLHAGATARPSVTHTNALGIDLHLRIAPELFLKRCVVGGLDRVFEINRNLQTVDSSHSRKFAMLEAYEAYSDHHTMATLTREPIQNAPGVAIGSHVIRHADGAEFNLGGKSLREVSAFGALSGPLDQETTVDTALDALLAHAARRGVAVDGSGPVTAGKVSEKLFDALVAPTLIEPTCVVNFPAETSPLVRGHRKPLAWPSAGASTRSDSNSSPATPSWSTPSYSGNGSRHRQS